MTRAATVATVAFGLAFAASVAIGRLWPKANAGPFALAGAGLVMIAGSSPSRQQGSRAAARVRPPAAIAIPPQQRAS